jgi:nitrous oxidase accessory protein NosD
MFTTESAYAGSSLYGSRFGYLCMLLDQIRVDGRTNIQYGRYQHTGYLQLLITVRVFADNTE